MTFSIIDLFISKLKSKETKEILKNKAEEQGFNLKNPEIKEIFDKQYNEFVNNITKDITSNKEKKNTNIPFMTTDILKEQIDTIIDTKQHNNRTLKISRINIHSLVSKEFFCTSPYELCNWSTEVWEFAIDYISNNIKYLKEDYYQYLFKKQIEDNKREERYWQEYKKSGFEENFNKNNKDLSGIDFEKVKLDWVKKKTPEEQIKYFGGSKAGKIRKTLLDEGVITNDKELELLYKTNDKGRKVLIPVKELVICDKLPKEAKELIKTLLSK